MPSEHNCALCGAYVEYPYGVERVRNVFCGIPHQKEYKERKHRMTQTQFRILHRIASAPFAEERLDMSSASVQGLIERTPLIRQITSDGWFELTDIGWQFYELNLDKWG
jgi:hypothetical protein